MFKKITLYFDRLEDRIRKGLSHIPIFYAFVGGAGVVLFWRGIWHTMDFIMEHYLAVPSANESLSISLSVWWDGPLSILIGFVLLLLTGIFTSSFIGNEIIISGLKGEKKVVEKTEKELQSETEAMDNIQNEIKIISNRLEKIEQKMSERGN